MAPHSGTTSASPTGASTARGRRGRCREAAWTQRERLPLEEGRCHLLLSDVLREQGETLEAAHHLDAAGDIFQRTGARLYLDQVLERRDLLKA